MLTTVFFDIDGTISSFRDYRVTDAAADAIRRLQANDIRVFACTGRSPAQVAEAERGFRFDGVVAFNGQYGALGDTVIWENAVNEQDKAVLLRLAAQNAYTIVFSCPDGQYVNFLDENALAMMKDFPFKPKQADMRALADKRVLQAVAYLRPGEEWRVMDGLTHCDFDRWNDIFMDVNEAGGGKGVGVRRMLEHCFIKREETVGFGDGESDIRMFGAVGHAVAMGNARDRVKAKAEFITGEVDGEGVLPGLRHYFPFMND